MSNINRGGKYIQTDDGKVRASVAEIDLDQSVSDILKQIDSMNLGETDIDAVIERERDRDSHTRSTLIRPLKKLIS